MKKAVADAEAAGQRPPTHFGPEANLLDELQNLFKTYGETGGGKRRYYVHDADESQVRGVAPGKFTP
ncbi:MAG: phosphoribulokinase, partial [Proteobacteria bacterium]|nr:phosphoribulokinase [Pseudomonadota bacterium]